MWNHDPVTPIGRAYPGRDAGGNLIPECEFAPEGVDSTTDRICGLVKSGEML